MKKVCVLTGIGFGDQNELIHTLKSVLGWVVDICEVGASIAPEMVSDAVRTADLIIARSPWTPTFEEAVYDEFLALKLQFVFEEIKIRIARGDKLKVLGIGRGAHVLVKLSHEAFKELRNAEWEAASIEITSWTPIRFNELEGSFMGQLYGGFLPKISVEQQREMSPWMVLGNGQIAGWKVMSTFYLSWVDPLSFRHPSQLSDYGYVDYSKILKCEDFLEQFALR